MTRPILIPLPQAQATKAQIRLIEDLAFKKFGLRDSAEYKITWYDILTTLNAHFHTDLQDINELDKQTASRFIKELKLL